MKLGQLDHVNVRTANLETMIGWYCDILGMTNGPRPPFPFPGAWLYSGDVATVHLIGVEEECANTEPKIEHFAFTARGLTGFIDKLNQNSIEARISIVPGYGILQVNIFDPDGNHIHVDFSPEEAKAAGY